MNALGRHPLAKTPYLPYRREDGEIFVVTSTILGQSAAGFWTVHYDAVHLRWGCLALDGFIDNAVAPSIDDVRALVDGDILEWVEAYIKKATCHGFGDGTMHTSLSGWSLHPIRACSAA